jgi:hypothetical protein
MKTKLILSMFLVCLMMSSFSQEKSKAELKEERKLENQKLTEALVNSGEFVFIGRTALPQGGRSVNLASRSNFMKFQPELIESDMPYYGRAYSGAGYGSNDEGLKFTGKPVNYTVTKNKKNYQVNFEVKGERDTYKISLSIGLEGSATLSVISMNRSAISYNGTISAPESKE